MLDMKLFSDIYRGRRVLLTGHTGFKGSWLALWLHEMGAEVTGVALAPEGVPNHWDLLQVPLDERRCDIRDAGALAAIVKGAQPELVFHLAAQSLVRRSYRKPLETWSTNVMGTANVLDACRQESSVRAIVVVTTDKCYENREWPWPYREIDHLGGHDPYSASKAAAELVAASFRSAFFSGGAAPLVATARAGNVIGGGDWSEDRLIPDLIRAMEREQSVEIRSSQASRPWQHVLDCLSGYLVLGQKLLTGEKAYAEAWNFGPEPVDSCTVAEVLDKLRRHWRSLRWHVSTQSHPHETTLLCLDSAKARARLGWRCVWPLDTTLEKTAAWYQAWLNKGEVISRQQLTEYIAAAAEAGLGWTNV